MTEKSSSPKITRMVLKSGRSGNVKVKFAGSEADFGGGAECSFTTIENGTSFEGTVLDDDPEDPLISLEYSPGTAKEASFMDATDPFVYLVAQEEDVSDGDSAGPEDDSEHEKRRREMIRGGKQAQRFSSEDITPQDNSDSQQQTPAKLLSLSDVSDQFSVQTHGQSDWTQDSLEEIEVR